MARRQVVLAQGLDRRTATQRALSNGAISAEHAVVIVQADRSLPTDRFLRQLQDNFTKLYRELFGRTVSASVEVITWRLRSSGGKDQVTRPHQAEVADALKGKRSVYFNELGAYAETPVYDH